MLGTRDTQVHRRRFSSGALTCTPLCISSCGREVFLIADCSSFDFRAASDYGFSIACTSDTAWSFVYLLTDVIEDCCWHMSVYGYFTPHRDASKTSSPPVLPSTARSRTPGSALRPLVLCLRPRENGGSGVPTGAKRRALSVRSGVQRKVRLWRVQVQRRQYHMQGAKPRTLEDRMTARGSGHAMFERQRHGGAQGLFCFLCVSPGRLASFCNPVVWSFLPLLFNGFTPRKSHWITGITSGPSAS